MYFLFLVEICIVEHLGSFTMTVNLREKTLSHLVHALVYAAVKYEENIRNKGVS